MGMAHQRRDLSDVPCVCRYHSNLLTGGDGQVYAWKGRVCFAVFAVHGGGEGLTHSATVDNDRLCT